MKALSIRQPWAWLICNAGKDIENRDWATKFRGRFLVHAAKGMTRDEYYGAVDFIRRRHPNPNAVLARMPDFNALERGGVVGEAELVDCLEFCDSPWFVGFYGFKLANAKPLPFTPLRGALGLFEIIGSPYE